MGAPVTMTQLSGTSLSLFPNDAEWLPTEKTMRTDANTAQASTLPGYPRVELNDTQGLLRFLEQEYCSSDMDSIGPYLWLMSMQSHKNISPLHRQKLKGRKIVVTEDPKLHLVWFNDVIFVKPLPSYLCSEQFWKEYIYGNGCVGDAQRERIIMSAKGYLRTWYYLVKHESDFRITQNSELQLLPQGMGWEDFSRLSARWNQIDNEVCPRYHYGEVRLRRLNLWSKWFLGKQSYQRMYNQYGSYFSRFQGIILFTFAVVSVLLNAMQVVMSVEQVDSTHWAFFWHISRWFGVVCTLLIVTIMLLLVALLVGKVSTEWHNAFSNRWEWTKAQKATQDVEAEVKGMGPSNSQDSIT